MPINKICDVPGNHKQQERFEWSCLYIKDMAPEFSTSNPKFSKNSYKQRAIDTGQPVREIKACGGITTFEPQCVDFLEITTQQTQSNKC